MPPLVSVLVLNYKQFCYVPHCLDGLMQQTYPAIEIIFTDNASGDESVDYVRSKYPHIRVNANSSNLYFCRAHNLAIKQSSGRYVLPLNVDIALAPTFVEQMVRAL